MSRTTVLRHYYLLTKPGIVFGNLIPAIGGFAVASKGAIDVVLLLATLVGLSLIIAASCVINNCIDRDIDALMERTKDREIVRGVISVRSAIIFACILGGIGTVVLALFTSALTTMVALAIAFIYVVMYSLWWKRTVYGTYIGSLAGAVPPVVGYVAVTNSLDGGAFILFLIVCLWQMPHFYAIAMRRITDYTAASIPVLPITSGVYATKIHILIFILAFTAVAASFTFFGYAGHAYLAIALILGISWFTLGVSGLKSPDNSQWARRMFLFSLVVLIALFSTLFVSSLLLKS